MSAKSRANARHRKNRAEAKKAVKAQFGRIDTKPRDVRRLKKSVRRRDRAAREKSTPIMPWLREPEYKVGLMGEVRKASLLGLPTELRQKVLVETVVWGEFEWCVKEWCGVLSCVAPLLRMDVQVVKKIWEREREEVKRDEVEAGRTWWFEDDIKPCGWSSGKKGRVSTAIVKKGKRRPHKCWRCEERHYLKEGQCPRAWRDPQKWYKETTRRETKNEQMPNRIVFDD
ncbi:hypothetical protein BU24DRAFT_463364 [Aaosphaeria arxii CBS 175.79]|uniref:Uncharacterized protein n=1 Tax=Aaosphaeria arxii CBS 175.79 TaxID=1450172 RepID=A0A6A5XMU4_9PLEO|nr:uncharacterized protein BU24DRAFT_463364 [Aaosphaeria arxii CBS 175.79]KAF2014585.1 hypothetical protein BU24DRAFT_463364 [Aaosphaeria arxii CBS 175.79]